MNDNKEQLIKYLREYSVNNVGEFNLTSGSKTTYYIDVKRTALLKQGHKIIGSLGIEILNKQNWNPNLIAGVALGGCSLASAIIMSQLPNQELHAIYIRSDKKEHGTKQFIEGYWKPTMNVVLIEDVITTGQSTFKAINILEAANLIVKGIVAVVDRLEGAEVLFQSINMPFISMTTIRELL